MMLNLFQVLVHKILWNLYYFFFVSIVDGSFLTILIILHRLAIIYTKGDILYINRNNFICHNINNYQEKLLYAIFYDGIVDTWMPNAIYVVTTIAYSQIWWKELPVYEHLQCVISHTRFKISFGIFIIDICKWNQENNWPKNIKLINRKHNLWIEKILKTNLGGHQLWTTNTMPGKKQYRAVKIFIPEVCWLTRAFE